MTTIADLRKTYYEASKRANEVGRQLALAAIGAIWLFKTSSTTGITFELPKDLLRPTFLIVLSLGIDLLLLLWITVLWGTVSRYLERRADGDDSKEFEGLPPIVNWIAIVLMVAKFACLIGGYALLLIFLYSRVKFA